MRKYSKQREEIQKIVFMSEGHPTAEEVYLEVKKTSPNISLGTVYRNLNLLCEDGIIKKISVPGTADKFDGTIKEHHHVICSKCKRAYDFNFDVNEIKNQVQKQSGMMPHEITLTVLATCPDCKNKEEKE